MYDEQRPVNPLKIKDIKSLMDDIPKEHRSYFETLDESLVEESSIDDRSGDDDDEEKSSSETSEENN